MGGTPDRSEFHSLRKGKVARSLKLPAGGRALDKRMLPLTEENRQKTSFPETRWPPLQECSESPGKAAWRGEAVRPAALGPAPRLRCPAGRTGPARSRSPPHRAVPHAQDRGEQAAQTEGRPWKPLAG